MIVFLFTILVSATVSSSADVTTKEYASAYECQVDAGRIADQLSAAPDILGWSFPALCVEANVTKKA